MEKVERRGGSVPHKKGLTYGWGINDADYPVFLREYNGRTNGRQNVRVIWSCPFYGRWKGMVERCHSEKFQAKQPTYIGCSVCEEWRYFSVFKAWMEQQDWEGNELDKDVLVRGNKIYSPETCYFVSSDVNKFFNDHSLRDKSCTLMGARQRKDTGKYNSHCHQLGDGPKYLGQFETEAEAHEAWLVEKRRVAVILASRQTDSVISDAILRYYDIQLQDVD